MKHELDGEPGNPNTLSVKDKRLLRREWRSDPGKFASRIREINEDPEREPHRPQFPETEDGWVGMGQWFAYEYGCDPTENTAEEDEWWHETREAAQKALDAANAAWDSDHPEPVPNGAVRAVKLDDGNIDELDVDDPDCWVVMDETGEWMVGNLDPVWCLVV